MFIEQAYSSNFKFSRYIPFSAFFISIILLNLAAIIYYNIDQNAVMQQEIEQSGEMPVFVQTVGPMGIFLLMLLGYVMLVHHQSVRSLTTSRSSVDWKRIFTSFFIWGTFNAVTIFASYYASPESFVLNFHLKPFLILTAISVVLLPMQTSFEEYFFRGYLMQGIGIATRSRLVPFIVTSVMFGLMHIANPEVAAMGPLVLLYYIGTGFFLGIITLMDEGLELSLGFHAANNLVACLLLTSDYSAIQTPSVFKDVTAPSAGIDVLLPVLVLYPILLFIFSRIYKWNNWKQRLTGKIVLPEVPA
ncbi:CPBP family intramembrane glutamic endopeptidase [Flavobacterium sp. RHBU_3]|uniref:CPBP family intramembrane glutamic endopeptidase n=1 Tax=Flavobacterium sp. RHBU_3 TaxID=3391184 RepID=UPI0039856179